MQTNFHDKMFALSLAFVMRFKEAWKWPHPHYYVFESTAFIAVKTKQNIFIYTSVYVSFSPIHTKTAENNETTGAGTTHVLTS